MTKQSLPQDTANRKLMQNVFPLDWKNKEPAPIYDLVILGGGPGGLVSSMLASSYNKKVALIDDKHLGGECLNVGCIPSKAIIRSSKLVAEIRNAKEHGIEIPKEWSINFSAVMKRVRELRSVVSFQDSVEKFSKFADIFLGKGVFTGPDIIEVAGKNLRFKKAILATGTDPMVPSIPGLEEAGYLTNQNVFDLSVLPKRLAVLGAGPIGCELSQAFLRFGSEVTMITRGPRIFSHEDMTATERLQKIFEKEGMHFLFNTQVKKVEKRGKEKVLYFEGRSETLVVDDILIGLGRVPKVQGIALEKAGVTYDDKEGIAVNDLLETSNPNIYSISDMKYKFTHISKENAKIAVHNALGGGKDKKSSLVISWCTFTDPEIAHVGLYEKDALEKGIPVRTILLEMADNDRAILDSETSGFLKLHVKDGTDQILGATLMAKHAGEMIAEIAVAIASEKGLSALARAIHPFPTQAETVRMGAEQLLKVMAMKTRGAA